MYFPYANPMGQNQIKNPRTNFFAHSSVWGVWKINRMILAKLNACMAVDHNCLTGPAEMVRSLPPWSNQKIFHLQSKSYTFKIMVGPITVWLRFLSNGHTSLALPPPLQLELRFMGTLPQKQIHPDEIQLYFIDAWCYSITNG